MEKEIFISIISAISWIVMALIAFIILQKIVFSVAKWNRRRKRSVSTRKKYEDFIISKKMRALN